MSIATDQKVKELDRRVKALEDKIEGLVASQPLWKNPIHEVKIDKRTREWKTANSQQ